MDVKNLWVSEIRKVLTGQLEACRGRNTHTNIHIHTHRHTHSRSGHGALRSVVGFFGGGWMDGRMND